MADCSYGSVACVVSVTDDVVVPAAEFGELVKMTEIVICVRLRSVGCCAGCDGATAVSGGGAAGDSVGPAVVMRTWGTDPA